MQALDDALPLPPLRPELQLAEAPPEPGGAARWRLDDPLRQRSFLLAEGDLRLLALWPLGRVGALRAAWQRSLAGPDSQFEQQLGGLMDFLRQHHLLVAQPGRDSTALAEQAARQAHPGLRGWFGRWMGWQLPLLRPQGFLEATLPLVRGLWTWPALLLWALCTLLGLYLVSRQWDAFIGSFAQFNQPEGWLAYALVLLALKLLHELGHAYAAVQHGVQVPSMGLSVAMGVPMFYTDTSGAVRLPRRAARLWIGGAGMLAESMLAGLCTLAWALLADGPLRSACFVVATSSWLTTLAINLNPLGRFDGYYMLSDALGLANLQQRALDHAGWAAGRLLLGPVMAAPEPAGPARRAGLIVFGAGVWLFRLSLGLAAAGLAYALLFQLAGLVLAAATLWWLLLAPLLRQLAAWWQLRGAVGMGRWLGLALLLAGLGWVVQAPLDQRVRGAAVLGWQHEQLLQAPEVATVDALLVRDGQPVRAGQLLLRLRSPELQRRLAEAENQRVLTLERLARIAGDARDRNDLLVLEQQRAEADAAVQGLRLRVAQLELRAQADGHLVDMPAWLQPGQWVRPERTLGRVLLGQRLEVQGYVDDAALRRLQAGAPAVFLADDLSLAPVTLRLSAVEQATAEQVTPELLASVHGGSVPTVLDKRGRAVPQQPVHRARFEVMQAGAPLASRLLRGQVQIEAEPESLAVQSGRRMWQLLLRELQG
ncbi:efflux RND transporter periplasmic adaptor subunit [Aquabacterium sp. OR-4]|uniref:efflux RND transporter periplasmic adaptor subunit n=1 Tax=Aquabacterium sp. OR-4 TaxID=2978127 RepID=UPI0028C94645|nr:HlyD family efflux transporter periplasmic adaptor subunit [Aquabacterium sp. OR-4]MDT7834253.1 biotin/lipoyl-binding protein [Aquabacterium sp. OR-4]